MSINDNVFDNDTDILSLLDIMLDFNENAIGHENNTADFFDNDNLEFNNNNDSNDNFNDYNDTETSLETFDSSSIPDIETQFDNISSDDEFWLDDYDDFHSNPIGIEDLFNLIWKE